MMISLPSREAIEGFLLRRSFNVKRRRDFYADLAAFMNAGIAPFDAMERIQMVARPRKSLKWLVKLLQVVMRRMKNGDPFAVAIRKWVPAEEASLLVAGEAGGRLKEALKELVNLLKSRMEVNQSLKENLIPSAGIVTILVLLMVFILKTVLAEARTLVSDTAFDKLMLAPLYFSFGQIFLALLPFLLVGGVVGTVVVSASLPRWKPSKTRMWLDANVPPYSLYSRMQSSFFLVSVSAMMQAGSPFTQAIESIQKSSNQWSRTHIRRMVAMMGAGKSEADAMLTGMIPWDVEDRLAVYKILDDFKFIMLSTARDSMGVLLSKVEVIGKTIRISAMACLGLFIVFTIFSIGEIALEAQSAVSDIQPSN